MELYPAVDIQGGRLARAQADDADAALRAFAAAGARWVHVVDLDRAYGRTGNPDVVQRLLVSGGAGGRPALRVQVGGGLATELDIDRMFTWGAARVIIGADGATDPGLVERLVARHGAGKLAVGIDVKDGRLAPRGAKHAPSVKPQELAARVQRLGIRTAIYTDVTRDGQLSGPDVAGARAFVDLGLDVIVSGGVASLDDLRAANAAGLAGAIVGRALHEGRFTLAAALACVA